MTTLKSVQVRIEGRVQGVWFRAWVAREAAPLGLSGWVRNRRDGSVEAVFSGKPDDVDKMLQRCWDGPPLAKVSNVEEQPCAAPDSGFVQLPTA
ncbi:MAG: acylphosphatase [Rhodospirillales bacterium]|nr:acylphosphatase [Rhodospirillales bacterium]